MQVLKTKSFSKWAAKQRIPDKLLMTAAREMQQGLIDASLGGHVYKKRVSTEGRGKRAGARTLIAYRAGDRAFFVYGFVKNDRANVSAEELEGLKQLARTLLSYSDISLHRAIQHGALIEVGTDEQEHSGSRT